MTRIVSRAPRPSRANVPHFTLQQILANTKMLLYSRMSYESRLKEKVRSYRLMREFAGQISINVWMHTFREASRVDRMANGSIKELLCYHCGFLRGLLFLSLKQRIV